MWKMQDKFSKTEERFHSATAYSKMSLEHFRSAISVIAADFARVAEVETMKFIQPVRNWLKTMRYKNKIIHRQRNKTTKRELH